VSQSLDSDGDHTHDASPFGHGRVGHQKGDPWGRADERLVLRPRWVMVVVWLLGSIPFLLLGAIGWASVLEGASNGAAWALGVVGVSIGLLPLALALRCRLILTPDGFRIRWLWRGRLVPWSAVRTFDATDDVGIGYPTLGARWLPRKTEELRKFWSYSRREIPTFGRSQQYMVETLNSWLNRYSGP
jgi:hypothetical protein